MAFWWKRYEPILEQKPVSGPDAVVDLIARELVEVLEAFPPAEDAIEWEDQALAAKLKGNLHELPRLDGAFVDLLAKVITWDLEQEIEAIDHLMRNHLHRDAAPTERHVQALHLLWRALLEHLYQRKEEAGGILKRAHLVAIVEKARVRYRTRQDLPH
jgi:hypothetical protein